MKAESRWVGGGICDGGGSVRAKRRGGGGLCRRVEARLGGGDCVMK